MQRSDMRELELCSSHPGCRCAHPGYQESGRASSPRVSSGPRACRLSCSSSPRRGVRNDRAFHRARGARMCWHTGSPHAAFAAHGQWPSPTPKIVGLNRAVEADLRLRSAREMDFAACCMSQGLSLAPTRPRSCELSPGHALGPSARLAGVCPCPLSRDLRSSLRPRSGIVAAIRIPLPRIEDDRDAPLTGAGWRSMI